jgi:NAD(P)-dependent dehydrogenase (short-subunit alcohol dehydrogenase family)
MTTNETQPPPAASQPPEATRAVVAVLGAGGGIGSALSRAIAAEGWSLLLGGRETDGLARLADETGGTLAAVDARDFERVEEFLSRAADLGSLTGVVNCAGSILLKPAHLTSRREFDETIATNLTTSFAVVRAAARVLPKEGGSIVLLASAAAQIGLPNHEAIAAAKAGVAGLTRSAAATYARRNIRVNAVAPGLIATPATERITGSEKALAASMRFHPLGRPGLPEEVASLILQLLRPEGTWITGQVWTIDGGLSSLKTAG